VERIKQREKSAFFSLFERREIEGLGGDGRRIKNI
jgi:hypothetical protein